MNLGKACAIFKQLEKDEYTDAEKIEAIRMVLDMETHNSITKLDFMCALAWLWNFTYHKVFNGVEALRETPEWIPIRMRPMTSKERIEFAKHYGIEYCDTSEEKAFDCPMPEDGQEILISTLWGVTEDVADNDIDGEGFICYGLEANGDWDGVEAWMPKPERYKKEGDQ